MKAERASWVKTRVIARIEALSYLRSPTLWVSLLFTLLFTVWTANLATTRSLELFLRSGEGLAMMLTAFVVTILISHGFAREEREAFDDVWNSLPTRNAEQFWGKVVGAAGIGLLFLVGLLSLLPLGWFAVGTVWTETTSGVVWAYVAQTIGILMFSAGLAVFLTGAVANLRLRYVLGLLVVVGLSIAQALGIDNHALWAVLLSPYTLGSLPYSQSLLFGLWPWGEAVVWHVLFQGSLAGMLILLGRLAYQRRRDPVQRTVATKIALTSLAICAVLSVALYVQYWNEVAATVDAQVYHDVQPGAVRTSDGKVALPAQSISHVRALGYDLQVRLTADAELHITAEVALAGDPEQSPWPLTLHHQWEVTEVWGDGIKGWTREGNFVWLELAPGAAPHSVVVRYRGRPLLWDKQIGVINPMHFMGERGGYLSPLLAWYPLPGQRRLVSVLYDMGQTRHWVEPVTDPLVTEPVPIRVRWEGPQQLRVVANLPTIEHSDAQGVHQAVFAGQSDGISLLVGALERIQASELTIVGAESVVYGAEVLGPAYDALVDFYEGLIGRALPREPVVVVPDWLARYYNPFHYRVPVSAYGQPGHMRPLTHMGAKPVVTESALAGAVRAAERWSRTESPHDLLAATAAINYGLLESIWGRPYTFQTVAEEQPVAQGIAEYLLLRWAEHVLGAEFDADLRAGIRAGTVMQRLNEREGVAQQVLTTLIDIEERHGDAAVSFVLGWVYDRLAVRPIDVAGFEEIVALRVGGEAERRPFQ